MTITNPRITRTIPARRRAKKGKYVFRLPGGGEEDVAVGRLIDAGSYPKVEAECHTTQKQDHAKRDDQYAEKDPHGFKLAFRVCFLQSLFGSSEIRFQHVDIELKVARL